MRSEFCRSLLGSGEARRQRWHSNGKDKSNPNQIGGAKTGFSKVIDDGDHEERQSDAASFGVPLKEAQDISVSRQ